MHCFILVLTEIRSNRNYIQLWLWILDSKTDFAFSAFRERVFNRKNSHAEYTVFYLRGGSREGARGAHPLPPEMTYCFLIQLYKICHIVWCVFSAVHIILLPSQKLSSSYSVLNFAYVTSQLRSHSLVVQLLQRKILDPNLNLNLFWGGIDPSLLWAQNPTKSTWQVLWK